MGGGFGREKAERCLDIIRKLVIIYNFIEYSLRSVSVRFGLDVLFIRF